MSPRNPDIDADLEILFYTEYLQVIQSFANLSSDQDIQQFEDLAAHSYISDPDEASIVEQSRTFLLRHDISLNILRYLLLKYIRLQTNEIIDDKIPFLTYAIAQSQFFSQYTTPEGLSSFINLANYFVKNPSLFFFKDKEHLLELYRNDKMITMDLEDNIRELNKILEIFTPRRRSERKRQHVDIFTDTTKAYGSYIENEEATGLIPYVKYLLRILINHTSESNKANHAKKQRPKPSTF